MGNRNESLLVALKTSASFYGCSEAAQGFIVLCNLSAPQEIGETYSKRGSYCVSEIGFHKGVTPERAPATPFLPSTEGKDP